nr:hydrogenase expression/formation protein HypE [Methanobrevibacter arboriphilus]
MKIGMSHGAGGEVMGKLISETILNNLSKKSVNGGIGLDALDDGATIPLEDYEVVVTTDGHTINPLFFPGGDIGRISAAGTINDVAVMGAKPLAITNAMIIKEGFSIEDLDKIIKSMDETCAEADVAVIAGDTKVMEQDKIDELVVVTTGIGIVEKGKAIRDSGLNVGDKIIITGSVGDHGMSLMSFREGFGFETDLKSDVAPVWGMVEKALEVGGVTAMKDPTRGGLANAINEMASKSGVGILLQDEAIPIKQEVKAVSDMLGIDPYEVANEGKIVMGVKPDLAEETLAAISKDKYGKDAAIIGEVIENNNNNNHVLIETEVGGQRILESPIADPVPRVC